MESWKYFPVLKETKFKFLDTIWKYVLALKITKTTFFLQTPILQLQRDVFFKCLRRHWEPRYNPKDYQNKHVLTPDAKKEHYSFNRKVF